MHVTIRPSQSDEIEEIISIQTEALLASQGENYSPRQIAALVKSQGQSRREIAETILLAESSNSQSIVGFACLSENARWINGLYVHPASMRKGVGTKLLQALEEMALEIKLSQPVKNNESLYVASSLVAIDFYRKNGYSTLRRRYKILTTDAGWIPSQLMGKELIPLTSFQRIQRKFIWATTWIILIALVLISVF